MVLHAIRFKYSGHEEVLGENTMSGRTLFEGGSPSTQSVEILKPRPLELAGTDELEGILEETRPFVVLNPRRENDPKIINNLWTICGMQQSMICTLLFQVDAMQRWSGYDQVRVEHQIELQRMEA
ncbi:Uncharacterised protein [uncultured archaeon]|nr:Uncharacterised protein [uncultured archaeon]